MRGRSRPIVPNYWVFSQACAERDDLHDTFSSQSRNSRADTSAYLLGQILKVLADQIIAGRMEENRKAPGIAESNQMRFSGVEVDVHDSEIGDAISAHLGSIKPQSLLGVENYQSTLVELFCRGPAEVPVFPSTYMRSTPSTTSCIGRPRNPP